MQPNVGVTLEYAEVQAVGTLKIDTARLASTGHPLGWYEQYIEGEHPLHAAEEVIARVIDANTSAAVPIAMSIKVHYKLVIDAFEPQTNGNVGRPDGLFFAQFDFDNKIKQESQLALVPTQPGVTPPGLRWKDNGTWVMQGAPAGPARTNSLTMKMREGTSATEAPPTSRGGFRFSFSVGPEFAVSVNALGTTYLGPVAPQMFFNGAFVQHGVPGGSAAGNTAERNDTRCFDADYIAGAHMARVVPRARRWTPDTSSSTAQTAEAGEKLPILCVSAPSR
eukprot:gene4958-24244_t